MTDTLNKYDYSFQTKVLSAMITDQKFTSRILDIFDSKIFQNTAIKWLFDKIVFYFQEYKKLPTPDVFKVQIGSLELNSTFQIEVISALKDIIKNRDSDDLPFVKDEVHTFFRHQLIINAYPQSIDLLNSGNIEGAVDVIMKAHQKGQREEHVGLDYLRDVEIRYDETKENERVPTGWSVIDDIMGGGLPKGKFGVFIAPTGQGKSWLLCKLGSEALKAGKTVLHYTLELDDDAIGQRYDGILTGIPMNDLKFNIPKIKRSISKFNGKLIIKQFPPSKLTIHGFESDIERSIQMGIVPDVVILDYPELLQINFNASTRDDMVLGELYKNLRGVAGSQNVALWGVDQTNRSGLAKNVIENDSVSNSYMKLFALDFVATLSRRPADKVAGIARLHVSKNRFGPDGLTFPMKFDPALGGFEVYHEKTTTGKEVKSQMLSDDQYALQTARENYQNAQMNSIRQEPKDDLF